jgi:hypothetical protein
MLLHNTQIRRDYRELLELSLMFLTGRFTFRFRKPSSISNARWMARVIYCLKMYFFRDHIDLSFQELENIRKMCRFSVFHYVFRWIKVPIICHSACNDLSFLKEMCDFEDQKVVETAIRKMTRHLWYL